MSEIAIRVENLSKRYQIGAQRTGDNTLGEALKAPFRRASRLLRGQARSASDLLETFWALKDVSFEVKMGEVLGVIGPNGAGKSTLLKILSRITRPTSGYAEIRGQVGSLLEVGTGFHPELTGRENVFFNGAVLGMSRAEIARKFDEIVAFAGVEKFIDTPVKFYSSGMYVRLAFAVAAHLEPDILLVDEVLSVGDAVFQRKCLGKINEVSGQGRTVLFVSHNMASINHICQNVLLLEGGQIALYGRALEVVQQYLSRDLHDSAAVEFDEDASMHGQILKMEILNSQERASNRFLVPEPVTVGITYRLREPTAHYRVGIMVRLPDGFDVLTSACTDHESEGWTSQPGLYVAHVSIPGHLLNVGQYLLSGFLGQPNVHALDYRPNALTLYIEGQARLLKEQWPGVIALPLTWEFEEAC